MGHLKLVARNHESFSLEREGHDDRKPSSTDWARAVGMLSATRKFASAAMTLEQPAAFAPVDVAQARALGRGNSGKA